MRFTQYHFIPLLGGLMGAIGGLAVDVRAQSLIVPDNTLGSEGSIVVRSSDFGLPVGGVRILGGANRGKNLFHSFQDFNVGNGENVLFVAADRVRNVFARVTGSMPSTILGSLGTLPLNTADGPSLFLLNPNGIIFGPNSNLRFDGAFIGSTANAIKFGDAGTFSASEPASPSPLLTVQPSAFLFTQLPTGNITFQPRSQFSPGGRLNRFTSNQDLVLLGGNINVDQTEIQSLGGYLSLGAVGGPGSILITPELKLVFSPEVERSDIAMRNQSLLTTQGREKGDVSIYGRNINISDSNISTGVPSNSFSLNNEPVGKITIDALGNIDIKNSRIASLLRSGSIGKTGGISIVARNLLIRDATQLTSLTFESSVGDSGNIDITANSIVVDGNPSVIQTRFTRILTANQGNGYAGNINVQVGMLELKNGGAISSGARSPNGFAIAGDLNITAENDIVLSGVGRVELDNSEVISENNSISSDLSLGRGKGGNIQIFSRSLIAKDGSRISTSSSGQGDAGNLGIFARDAVLFEGVVDESSGGARTQVNIDGVGNAGRIRIESPRLDVLNGAQIASAAASGQANNIEIQSRVVTVDGIGKNGKPSLITSQNGGSGKSGNIEITADRLSVLNGGGIGAIAIRDGIAGRIDFNLEQSLNISNDSAVTTESLNGLGGNIGIRAKTISLSNNGDIKTSVFNSSGDAGNISLKANFIIARGDSDILAFAQDGKGGNIAIQAIAGLFPSYRPALTGTDPELLDGNNRVDINASGRVSGIITFPETNSLQNNRSEFNPGLIDTDQILSRSCLARNPKTGKFYITGIGGVPLKPGDRSLSTYSTLPVAGETSIAEAEGIYPLDNGQFVMGRTCQTLGGKP